MCKLGQQENADGGGDGEEEEEDDDDDEDEGGLLGAEAAFDTDAIELDPFRVAGPVAQAHGQAVPVGAGELRDRESRGAPAAPAQGRGGGRDISCPACA